MPPGYPGLPGGLRGASVGTRNTNTLVKILQAIVGQFQNEPPLIKLRVDNQLKFNHLWDIKNISYHKSNLAKELTLKSQL